MVAGKAERRPPVEVTDLDVHAAGALQDGGVPVSAVIDDADPPARTKDPDGFAQSPGAFLAAPDVAEGQAAEHHVERPGGKGKIPCVGVREFDALADALDPRVALGGCPAVARLVTQAPDVGSGRAAPGQAVGRRDQDGAPAAADVEHALVAAQAELVEQFVPDRPLARAAAVEIARGYAGHGDGRRLRQRAGEGLAPPARPPVAGHETGSEQDEVRNGGIPSVDAVPGPVPPRLDEPGDRRGEPPVRTAVLPWYAPAKDAQGLPPGEIDGRAA